MPDLPEVLAALADALGGIPDVFVYDVVQAQPTPPCLQLLPSTITYTEAIGRGMDTADVTIQGIVGVTDGGQRQLHGWMSGSGPASVVAAVWADPTLGLAGAYANITAARGPALASIGGISYLLTEWTVTIHLSQP